MTVIAPASLSVSHSLVPSDCSSGALRVLKLVSLFRSKQKEISYEEDPAAVDGSKPSDRFLRMAASLAVHFGAELTLVNVLAPLFIPTETGGATIAQIEDDRKKDAGKLLSDTERYLEEPGLTVKRVIREGPVAETIEDLASSERCDLVVVGSRGQGAAARVLLGSVSGRLVHICKQPILIVR